MDLVSGVFPLAMISQLWYAAPLIVAVSLVYAATRHEAMFPILQHAVRFGAWICSFMLLVLLVLLLLTRLT